MIEGSRTELINKVTAAMSKTSFNGIVGDHNLPYSSVDEGVQVLVNNGYITAGNKNTLMTAIGNTGYGIGNIGIAAAYRE